MERRPRLIGYNKEQIWISVMQFFREIAVKYRILLLSCREHCFRNKVSLEN